MKDAALLQLAKRRARQLKIDADEVLDAVTLGAYHSAPLSLVEYCMHEAAHLITLGLRPEQFKVFLTHLSSDPNSLQTSLGSLFDRLSKRAGDALEIDTAIITYLAGVKLGLWSDSAAIEDSCAKNLSTIASSEMRAQVRAAFEAADRDGFHSRHYHSRADELARWFEGRSQLRNS